MNWLSKALSRAAKPFVLIAVIVLGVVASLYIRASGGPPAKGEPTTRPTTQPTSRPATQVDAEEVKQGQPLPRNFLE